MCSIRVRDDIVVEEIEKNTMLEMQNTKGMGNV